MAGRTPAATPKARVSSELGSFAGAVAGRGRLAGVQAAEPADTQVDDPALLAVQGGLGLDHSDPGRLHGHFHALRGCVSVKRARL